ncbi:MAG: FMN-binding protein, partial [Bacteroidota bacterium]
YTSAGEYVSITVKKGGAEEGNPHQVDGITGATVTADGVSKMLYEGIKNYQPFLESLKGKEKPSVQGMLVE